MKRSILMAIMVTFALLARGQSQTITGKVTDHSDNSPLPGVSVLIKGTTEGTITDGDGNYSIESSSNDVLAFSYIGFISEEIEVGNQSVINVSLMADITQLDEIVVIGFGTQEKKDVTGSISSVKGETLNEIPAPSFEQALTGRAAGVQVTQSSGVPGAGANINIRGIGTVNNAQPLYVVDGVIMGNISTDYAQISPLSMINPNDIESIDILKDASASAIFGARAANGVVIITTKRGATDQMRVTFSASYSTFVVDDSKFNRLSGPDWAEYYDDLQTYMRDSTYTGQPFVQRVVEGERPQEYNWLDEALRNGVMQDYGISISGGNQNSQYFASLGYMDQTGIMLNSDLKRYSMRLNSDHKFGRLKFGNTFYVARSESNRVGMSDPSDPENNRNLISRLVYINPYHPVYGDDGDWANPNNPADYDPDFEGAMDYINQNALWRMHEFKDFQEQTRLVGSFYGDWEMIDGLNLRSMVSADITYNQIELNEPGNDSLGAASRPASQTALEFSNNQTFTWFIENTLTYNKKFGSHSLTAMAGYQAQNTRYTSSLSRDGDFVNPDPDIWHFGTNEKTQNEIAPGVFQVTDPVVGDGLWEEAWVSYFGRIMYEYKDRYLLTATVRRDGSSKFGSEERWGTFPAFSAGWRIKEEAFMQGIEVISSMKLRAGYGISGSDNTPRYQYQSLIGQQGQFNYSFDETHTQGGALLRPANPFIRWERMKMMNVGLDLGLYKNRLEFVIDYFTKTTEDMFFQIQSPLEGGFESNVSVNAGEVKNSGLELTIRSVNIVSPIRWNTDLNVSFIKNEVVNVANLERIGGTNGVVNQVAPGGEIGEFFGYEVEGIFQDWDEVYNHAYQNQATTGVDSDGDGINDYNTSARDHATGLTNTAPGDVKFRDTNGDGIVDADDWTVIGSPFPDFSWGMTNTFSYKGISLSILLQGVHGVDIYGNSYGRMFSSNGFYAPSTLVTKDRWSPENTGAEYPRIFENDAANENFRPNNQMNIEDGSYVRIKNLRLAYNLPQKILKSISSANAQIYVTATNLVTFTKYSGYDPEVGGSSQRFSGDQSRRQARSWTYGQDSGTVPLTRQFTVGASITF